MVKITVTFKIDSEIKKEFQKKTSAKGIQMSFMVEQMMKRYLQNNEKEVQK